MAASGKVGIEEDVNTHKEDGVEIAHAGPEGAFLGCQAIAYRRLRQVSEGYRLYLGVHTSSPSVVLG